MDNILRIWFVSSNLISAEAQNHKNKVIKKLAIQFKKIIITKNNPDIVFLLDNQSFIEKNNDYLIINHNEDFLASIIYYMENKSIRDEKSTHKKFNEILFSPELINVKETVNFSKEIFSLTNSTPNMYFDEIYCVNLNRAHDRWMQINRRFQKHGLTVYRWEGFDKNTEFIKSEYKKMERNFKRNGYYDQSFSTGTCAIYLSHLELLKHIEKTNAERVLLLEDDATFHKNFIDLFNEQLQILPQNWDIWYLGVNQNPNFINKCEFNETKEIFRPYECWGMFGVALNKRIIPEIIKGFEEHYYHKYSSDAVLVEDFQKTEKYNIYASNPTLIGHAFGKSLRCDREFSEELTKKHIPSIYFDPKVYT